MKLLLLLSVYLVYVVRAQVVVQGKCPDIPDLASPLDKEKVLGTWYVYKLYPNLYDEGMKCSKDRIESFNGKDFTGSFHYINTTSDRRGKGTYVAINKEGTNGKFITKFSGRDGGEVEVKFQVAAVDYDNYNIGWSCTENEGISYRLVWVETRSKTVSDEVMQKILKIFESNNLDASKLVSVDHTNCHATLLHE